MFDFFFKKKRHNWVYSEYMEKWLNLDHVRYIRYIQSEKDCIHTIEFIFADGTKVHFFAGRDKKTAEKKYKEIVS